MATIWTLSKKGAILKDIVKEDVSEVWLKLNGDYDANIVFNSNINRDYMFLTDEGGKPFIFHKRYLWKITE